MTEAGGVANGTPGMPTATGDLDAADVDNPPLDGGRHADSERHGYGTYTLTAAGAWIYTLDNSNAAVQALNVGHTLTDTLHGDHGRRHHAVGDRHHHRRQRRRCDHRRDRRR